VTDFEDFIARYAAVWNEADADARRKAIPGLWSTEVSLYNRVREYHGLRGIEQATQRSCDLFVAKGYTFRPRRQARTHHDAIRFDWEMLDPNGVLDTLGTQFMVLDAQGRIRLDYQFTEPVPASDEG
jgi:hypothetical protein